MKARVLLLLLAVALAGCGSAAGSAPTAAPTTSVEGLGTVTTAPDGVQEVTLQTQDDYVFTPAAFTVTPGDKKTIEFTVDQPGDYAFECSFHTQLHQVGVMTVQG